MAFKIRNFILPKVYTLGKMASASIYKIRNRITGKCYIGCTTLPIDVRIYQHEKAGNPLMADKAWDMEVLEKCAAEDRFEREHHWIQQFRSSAINKVGVRVREERPNRLEQRKEYLPTNLDHTNMTKAEYNRKYKTEVRKKETQQYNQDYYDKNREKLTKKTQCGCGGSYCQLSRSQHLKTKRHVQWELETELAAFIEPAIEN